ncbi:MAG: type I-G CRISPR-associated protein Cas8g2 [Terriglobales bacterium]
MAEAVVPVDLINPGQVFACMGFLEAAEALLGRAEGGFEWEGGASSRFRIGAAGAKDPVAAVLEFLAQAEVRERKPDGVFPGPRPRIQTKKDGSSKALMALPITLSDGGAGVELGHWADGSGRDTLKLYSGNRSAAAIARSMCGAIARLWQADPGGLSSDPFLPVPVGGTFNFDARRSWTPIDAGYSPDQEGQALLGSPVVELLSAWGLENARPRVGRGRAVEYGVWRGVLPPALARAALGGIAVAGELRRFHFTLKVNGKNKVVSFAYEEEGS